MKINFIKLTDTAITPDYATPGSAGLDLYADISHPIHLRHGVRFTCPTGIAIELPEGFEAQIRPRSGLAAKHGITVLNAPGTIDADYRGPIGVILFNASEDGQHTINPGDRIAQMIIAPVIRAELAESDCLAATERGAGGFGSTGTN